MACSCTKSSKTPASYTVIKPGGGTYKTYSTKLEAEAAAARIGGTVK